LKAQKFTKKRSKIHSTGIFAKCNIAKGTRIIEYVGEKITNREAGRRVDASQDLNRKDGAHGAVYIFELNYRYSVDGNVPYNLARHINHSCDPNAKTDVIRGKIWIIAVRDIKKGEEIAYNYGYDFSEDYRDHPCRCGTARCVGYILKENLWPLLPVKLKKSKAGVSK
jgi:SET domain-containing protein